VAEKAESSSGWLFPVGDEVNELGYNHMFTDMFESIEKKREPSENFYDGYVVNCIIDAAYRSAKSRLWEPIQLDDWRGRTDVTEGHEFASYDDNFYLIKEEVLPNGEKKLILKNKKSGEVVRRDL